MAEISGFDFRCPDVISISVDMHKYGFAAKGNSVILYRSKKASLLAMGKSGYVDSYHSIVGTRVTIENALREHPGLSTSPRVIGEPMVSVVAFESVDPVIDIYDVADGMSAKGWHLNALQDPPGIHVVVTTPMVKAVDILIEDLVSVTEAEKGKAVQRAKRGGVAEKQREQASALYGVAGQIPDKTVGGRLVVGFLDTLYKR